MQRTIHNARENAFARAQRAFDNLAPDETVDVDALMQDDVREANGDASALAYYRAEWEARGWVESRETRALACHLASLASATEDCLARLSAKGRKVSVADWQARFAHTLPAYVDGMPCERERMEAAMA